MSDDKTEYLESIHKQFAGTRQLLDGIEKVKQGGVEGIQVVASEYPEFIIEAFDGLGKIIELLQKDLLDEVEARFKLLDAIER